MAEQITLSLQFHIHYSIQFKWGELSLHSWLEIDPNHLEPSVAWTWFSWLWMSKISWLRGLVFITSCPMGTLSRVHIYNYAKTTGRNEDCLGWFWNIRLVYWAQTLQPEAACVWVPVYGCWALGNGSNLSRPQCSHLETRDSKRTHQKDWLTWWCKGCIARWELRNTTWQIADTQKMLLLHLQTSLCHSVPASTCFLHPGLSTIKSFCFTVGWSML